jgi:hypothetical protein
MSFHKKKLKWHSAKVGDVLTDSFMAQHTKYPTLDAFFEAGGFTVNCAADLTAALGDVLDLHVKNSSEFDSWYDMQVAAIDEYTLRNSLN